MRQRCHSDSGVPAGRSHDSTDYYIRHCVIAAGAVLVDTRVMHQNLRSPASEAVRVVTPRAQQALIIDVDLVEGSDTSIPSGPLVLLGLLVE